MLGIDNSLDLKKIKGKLLISFSLDLEKLIFIYLFYSKDFKIFRKYFFFLVFELVKKYFSRFMRFQSMFLFLLSLEMLYFGEILQGKSKTRFFVLKNRFEAVLE